MARIVIEEACEHGHRDRHSFGNHAGGWHWEHCPGGSRRVLDPGSYLLAAQTCSECGASFGQCFQSNIKCCPDCNHFPDGRDLVQWWDALAGGEQP